MVKIRVAGILMPITALPSRWGIGCFSKEAYDFVDWLESAGQSLWQILPLGPTGFGDSPYQSFSAFAGNPYMISLDEFISEGLLTDADCERYNFSDGEKIDYAALWESRYKLLKQAFEKSCRSSDDAFKSFCAYNAYWLDDYSLFTALKNKFGGREWLLWDDELKVRDKEKTDEARQELSEEIEFQKFLQYKFFAQWSRLKAYANDKGIKIIGDIPIYASMDSADVWANPELFQLDGYTPTAVAGCPPDAFSPEGQLWGNPLYRWEKHRETGYEWWIKRLDYCFRLYDMVRIDHFRGFDEYYSIPYGNKTAVGGEWKKGPGYGFFEAVKASIGDKSFIAEDLGFITPSVVSLLKKTGFPGMKVLEFAFDSRDSSGGGIYLPHNYPENCIVYTGTHDNQTLRSWFSEISDDERKMVREYLADSFTPPDKLNFPLIALIMRSSAKICIVPIQDYLELGEEARINTPSTLGNNWRWRLREGQLTDELAERVRSMTAIFARCGAKS